MSILTGYRQTQDRIHAALGDPAAQLRLAAAGVRFTKLTPVSAQYSRSGRYSTPIAAIAGQARYGTAGVDVGQHQDQYRHFAGMTYSIIRLIANRIAGQALHHARRTAPGVGKPPPGQRRISKSYLPDHLKSAQQDLSLYTRSPVLDAFRNPNPAMVQHTLMFNTVASLELTGKGYWWLRWEENDDDHDGRGGEPQIWQLPAHWVEAVHTPERLFAAWKIRPGGGGEEFTIPAGEMVYFYYPDPSDPLAAYSPLVAMAKTVMADESIEESVRRTFLNAVAPSFAITIGQPAEASGAGVAMPTPVLSRAQRKALKSILLEEYRGTLNNGMPLILDGFIKAVQNLNTPPREFDFLNSAAATEARLCKGWGVNPISMGHVEGANRASSAVADEHLCKNVINPRLVLLSQTASCVMPQYYTNRNDEVVFFEPAVSSDTEFELEVETAMVDRGAMSNNEWRERRALPRMDGGDSALIDTGESDRPPIYVDVLPEGEGRDPNSDTPGPAMSGDQDHDGAFDEPPPEDEEDTPPEDERADGPARPTPGRDPRPVNGTGRYPNTAKLPAGSIASQLGIKAVAERHASLQLVYEAKMTEAVGAVLTGLAAEYRERVGKLDPAHVDELRAVSEIDSGHWERALASGLTPLIREAALAGAAQEWILAHSFQSARRLVVGDGPRGAVKSYLPGSVQARVHKSVKTILESGLFRRMVGTIKTAVRRAAATARKTGLSVAIAAVAAVASQEAIATHAARIAQAESQMAVGVGQVATFRALQVAGKVSRRMWKSMRDDRVRDTHEKADGQIVMGGEPFTVGGHQCQYPGDPTLPGEERYGCRCVVITLE